MNIIPWRKHRFPAGAQQKSYPMLGLQNEINSLFDEWFDKGWPASFSETKQAYIPAVDIIEKDKFYLIKAELPGLKEDEVELYIEDGYMVMKGERKEEKKQEKNDYIVHESNYGSFYRSFPVPQDAEPEKGCKTSFKKGVLSVELPKLEGAKSKKEKIAIKSG